MTGRFGSTLALMALAAGASTLVACAGAGSSSGGLAGSSGSTGAGGSVGPRCTTTACLPALTGSLVWAVEITPPSSSSAAITQLAGFDLSALASHPLMADAQSAVSATFTAPASAALPASANVVITVPSLIAGRPALTFEAPASGASTSSLSASLSVPLHLVSAGVPATLALVPLPPSDQQSPPYTSTVTLAANVGAQIAAGNFSISGTLESAFATPPATTFVARAFEAGALVSNAPLTNAQGAFQLLVPAAAAGNALTVQLTPLTPPQNPTDPWFVSMPIMVPAQVPTPYSPLGTMPIMLPAYTTPNLFGIAVVDARAQPIGGVTVQAQTTLATTSVGSTQFSYTATTGTSAPGVASLGLLPGTAGAPRSYTLVAIPPPTSSSGTTCSSVSVTSGAALGSTAPPPSSGTITLLTRPVLAGTVRDAQGYALANVAITATPGPQPTGNCPSTPASPGSTTTDAQGGFSFPLDPGTYQLDYDPPAGSAAPRLTESLQVGQDLDHEVTLPAAVAVEGMVVGQDGTPLSSTTVRFYDPQCTGTDCAVPPAPTLRAQVVTDANGAFVVAVPSP
ncbi:MAG TPA: carboxypeptidase-like regulatory domain-containing protein [Polyangia bacterium]|nr:carboxypeptidase-like regulatory domain-containing protein [Polyangia bacterium]